MESFHEEKAVEYYSHNFNCTQGVFTTYAIEHGIDEKLALRIATNFGGGARKGEKQENNPWELISLDDYENHMSLESVQQLQKMNAIMSEQFDAYPVKTAMVLGVAGGNGLEHVRKEKYQTVYGVDINKDYLRAASERYKNTGDVLKFIRADLTCDSVELPKVELVIANLLIEYIGYSNFINVIRQIDPKYVSCVIQINTDEGKWVSDSPYIHAFDGLDSVHCQMEEKTLSENLTGIGYCRIFKESVLLPNGKALLRLDFGRDEK